MQIENQTALYHRHGRIKLLNTEMAGVQPWTPEHRNDCLLQPSHFIGCSIPSNTHVHSRIKMHGVHTQAGETHIQQQLPLGCLCEDECTRIGFLCISEQQNNLTLYMTDSINDRYSINMCIQTGVTLVSWCQHTLFSTAQGVHSKSINASIATSSTNTRTTLHTLGIDNQFHSTARKISQPFRLNAIEEEIEGESPEVVVVTNGSVPALWLLARLALGLPGVAPGGIGDVESMVGAVRPELWQWAHFLLGHDSSPVAT